MILLKREDMKFEIKELSDKNLRYFEISLEKGCIDKLKQELEKFDAISIDFETLNISQKLYGETKKQSVEIQKANLKKMLKLFKVCAKVVKILKSRKFNFDGTIYVSKLSEKKNNNDFMIASMLDAKFNYNIFKRMGVAVNHACDYLDKENEINNMCDFKDNKCVSHRENNINKNTGCCPSFCKFTECKVCTVKNISCKIFMCDYLEERGYYFTPHTIPILHQHLNILERFVCIGMLFKTTKRTIARLWFVRGLLIALGIAILGAFFI